MAEARRSNGASWWWYVVASVIAGVGLAAATVVGILTIVRYQDRIDDFQRIPVGQTGVITFRSAGGYSAYYELPYDSDDLPEALLELTVEPVEGEGSIPIEPYDSDVTYDTSGHHGEALASFRIPEPGSYSISSRYAPDTPILPGGILAVGRGLGRGVLGWVLLAVGLGAGSVVLAIVITVVTAVRRDRAARVRAWRSAVPPARPWP